MERSGARLWPVAVVCNALWDLNKAINAEYLYSSNCILTAKFRYKFRFEPNSQLIPTYSQGAGKWVSFLLKCRGVLYRGIFFLQIKKAPLFPFVTFEPCILVYPC